MFKFLNNKNKNIFILLNILNNFKIFINYILLNIFYTKNYILKIIKIKKEMEPTLLDKIKSDNNDNENNNNTNEILKEIENDSSNTPNSLNKDKKFYKKYENLIEKFEENIFIEIEKYDNTLLEAKNCLKSGDQQKAKKLLLKKNALLDSITNLELARLEAQNRKEKLENESELIKEIKQKIDESNIKIKNYFKNNKLEIILEKDEKLRKEIKENTNKIKIIIDGIKKLKTNQEKVKNLNKGKKNILEIIINDEKNIKLLNKEKENLQNDEEYKKIFELINEENENIKKLFE